MKKQGILAVAALLVVGLALVFAPILAAAHEAPGVCRAVADCHSVEPGQQRACRDCLNRGGGHHFHPNTGVCHVDQRPRKRQ